VKKNGNVTPFDYGDRVCEPIDMKAGEAIQINTEWNFGDGSDVSHPPDWGISTYGNGAEDSLHLVHNGGLDTDSWEPIERSEDMGNMAYTQYK